MFDNDGVCTWRCQIWLCRQCIPHLRKENLTMATLPIPSLIGLFSLWLNPPTPYKQEQLCQKGVPQKNAKQLSAPGFFLLYPSYSNSYFYSYSLTAYYTICSALLFLLLYLTICSAHKSKFGLIHLCTDSGLIQSLLSGHLWTQLQFPHSFHSPVLEKGSHDLKVYVKIKKKCLLKPHSFQCIMIEVESIFAILVDAMQFLSICVFTYLCLLFGQPFCLVIERARPKYRRLFECKKRSIREGLQGQWSQCGGGGQEPG